MRPVIYATTCATVGSWLGFGIIALVALMNRDELDSDYINAAAIACFFLAFPSYMLSVGGLVGGIILINRGLGVRGTFITIINMMPSLYILCRLWRK